MRITNVEHAENKNIEEQRPATMGFCAMFAREYKLIVLFVYQLSSGLKNHGRSAKQRALKVIGNLLARVIESGNN